VGVRADDFEGLEAWLEKDEAPSRKSRVRRLQLLVSEYGTGEVRLFPGGPISAVAFNEARLAYLHGLFVATTLLSQTCLEHMLTGLFQMSGRNDLDRSPYAVLLREARDEQFILLDVYDLFDRLRNLRNPYAHPRPPGGKGSWGERAVQSATPIDDLIVEDAELVITALLRLCRRPPFAI
jgi:hypothetical protein